MQDLPVPAGRGAWVARAIRNALWLLVSQGGGRLIGFALGIVLARRFGAAGFGAYAFVMTYVLYFSFAADAGLGRLLIRDVARAEGRTGRLLEDVLGLRLALAGVAYLLMLAGAVLAGTPAREVGYIALAGSGLATGAVSGALASVYVAREQMRVAALFGLLSSGTTALAVLGALIGGAGLLGTFVAGALANLPPLLCLAWHWRRHDPWPRPRLAPAAWRASLRASLPYAALSLVGLIYFRVDALMLAWLEGPRATGIYTAAYRLFDAVTDIPGVAVAALFPTLARLHQGPRAELRRTYARVVAALAVLGVPALLGLVLLAEPIVVLLYGDGFSESAAVLRWLSLAVYLIFLDTANTMLLYSGDNLGRVLGLSLVTAAANVLLNLILIPRYSYNGAAIATVLASALSLAIFTPVVLRYLRSDAAPASSS